MWYFYTCVVLYSSTRMHVCIVLLLCLFRYNVTYSFWPGATESVHQCWYSLQYLWTLYQSYTDCKGGHHLQCHCGSIRRAERIHWNHRYIYILCVIVYWTIALTDRDGVIMIILISFMHNYCVHWLIFKYLYRPSRE